MCQPRPRLAACTMAVGGESPPKKRAKRGDSGLPSGITVRGKKYQVRLSHVPTGGTRTEQRSVGIFETVDQAVAALADAQRKYAYGGAAAVWPEEKEQRAARGSVRAQPSPACAASPQLCLNRSCVALRWCDRKRSRSPSPNTWLRCLEPGAGTTRPAMPT